MRVNTNGVELAYAAEGTGKPLLFIHGFPLTRQIWDDQLSDLGDIARMFAVDLRGHGDSQPYPGLFSNPEAYTMQLLASDCTGFLDELYIREPVIVCGLSMGGYVALNFVHQYPQRVAGLALVATRAGADSPAGRAGREAMIQLIQERGPGAVIEQMLPKLLAGQTAASNPELVTRLHGIMDEVSAAAMIGDLLGMKDRPDATPWLPTYEMPTLLVHGADDQIIPLSEARSMHAALPNARLEIIPQAGHLPNMEQPELFNGVLREFLSGIA